MLIMLEMKKHGIFYPNFSMPADPRYVIPALCLFYRMGVITNSSLTTKPSIFQIFFVQESHSDSFNKLNVGDCRRGEGHISAAGIVYDSNDGWTAVFCR